MSFTLRITVALVCVLVVDDEATLLKNVAQSLRRDGIDVLTALDCAAARDALSRSHVDVLCLDVHLPDGDGLDLLEEFRETVPDLPAIVISGGASVENESRAARLGVQQFLHKPFQLTELKSALAKNFKTAVNKPDPIR